MAGQSLARLPAAALRDLKDFCRSCKGNLTGKDIRIVREWCCACLSKRADDHTHVCEYDFGATKQQCVSCSESHYANTGNSAKPCVGPPLEAQRAASDLTTAADTLCAVEYKLAKAKDKITRVSGYKLDENHAKVEGYAREAEEAKREFDQAAGTWKTLLQSYGRSAVKASKKRLAEDEAAGLTSSEIYKKQPAASQSIDTAGGLGGQQPDIFKEMGDRCLKDLGMVETVLDEGLASLVRFSQTAGVDLSGTMVEKVNKRLKAIDEAYFRLGAYVNHLKSLPSIPGLPSLSDHPYIGDAANSGEEDDTRAFGLSYEDDHEDEENTGAFQMMGF